MTEIDFTEEDYRKYKKMKQEELSKSDRVYSCLFGTFSFQENITVKKEDVVEGYEKFRDFVNEAKEHGLDIPFNAE